MCLQNYRISPTHSWEELGEAGEQKVLAVVPEGFFCFRNILVPCRHGNDFEEIDLAVVGSTGIWSIEVKNWRGIAYPGEYPDELCFIRNASSGHRTSFRENPFYQARRHAEDMHFYLKDSLKKWFPSVKTLVVFASRDPNGVNGVNLNRVRHTNPSLSYIDELASLLKAPGRSVRAWDGWHKVKDALSKLRTWDVIHFRNAERKRGLLCQWEGFNKFKIRSDAQIICIDWGKVSHLEVIHQAQGMISARFVFQSGDVQMGELLDNAIPVQFPDGRIEWIKFAEIREIHTGFPCAR